MSVSAKPDLSAPLPEEVMVLAEQGRTQRTTVLPGTEGPNRNSTPYAKTHVEIDFADEEQLINCVKLLHWSDERLRGLPELIKMWAWLRTERERMTIYFSTAWYDKSFFEARNAAFQGRDHARYYAMFGATLNDLRTRHQVL